MKISDYILSRIEPYARHIFCLVGGGAMHLNDSLTRSALQPVFMLHEQGAGYAACAYGQLAGLGVCMTTAGPGATNAITGCLAAWMDSIPVIFISGGVPTAQRMKDGQRYNGAQECDIISMVKPITKYAITILQADEAQIVMDTAIRLAVENRRGPVWVEVPLDIQAQSIFGN